MKTKIFLISLLLTPSLSSCGNTKQLLLRNFSYFLNNILTDENCFVSGTKEIISNLIDTKIPFIVYLTSEGCSTCNQFSPIMTQWAKNEANLVVKITNDNAIEINRYFDGLFEQPINEKKQLVYPTVGIVNSKESFDVVDYSKYMKTQGAFTNYMNRKFKSSNIYFTDQNPYSNKNYYTVISYNNKNQEIKKLYNDLLVDKIKNSKNTIIISNYEADDLEITKIDDSFDINNLNKIKITSDTNQENINL